MPRKTFSFSNIILDIISFVKHFFHILPNNFRLCGCNPMTCLHSIYGNAGGALD